ncbi:putative alpha-amylase [Helianthus anomalus]
MDHNQDAHRQRILDWINDTNGTAGEFDVSTKGILHSVCIYIHTHTIFFNSIRSCIMFRCF